MRKYYKYVYTTWTQPRLIADGIIGGDDFAVQAVSEYNSNYQAYMAFDSSTSSEWATAGTQNPSWITFYSPTSLNVTLLTLKNRSTSTEAFTAGAIYGSNDNSNWVELTTYTNSMTASNAIWTVDLSSNIEYYKYYKISGTSFSGTNNGFSNIDITATQRIAVESNSSDYDFYKDIDIFECIKSAPVKTYYRYSKLPNVEVTGTPLIENGIIKTYSTSNYTQVNDMCKSYDNIDYIVKFKSSNTSTLCVIISSVHFTSLEIYNNYITCYNNKTRTRHQVCPMSADTWYYVKINMNRQIKTIYYSLNGIDWTLGVTITNDTNITTSDTPLRFGVGVNTDYGTGASWISEQIFTGEIDLSGCYIQKGDKILWRGTKVEESPEPPLYYNYDVVIAGKPTLNNGIASNFSSTGYLKAPVNFNTSNSWEHLICFTTGSDINTTQVITCNEVAYWGYGVAIQSNKIRVDLSSSTSSTNMKSDTSTTALANTKYWVKTIFNGTNYISSYSTNGTTWTEIFNLSSLTAVSSGTPIFGLQDDKNCTFYGLIDLTESYIKVNGEYLWQGSLTTSNYDYYKNTYYHEAHKETSRTPHDSLTIEETDSIKEWKVPEGLTQVHVDCVASKGKNNTSAGGNGGRVQCDLTVTPGQTYYLVVGSIPSDSRIASYNASDIRTSRSGGITGTDSLNSRILVAGGGGSGSAGNGNTAGGAGGGDTSGASAANTGCSGGGQGGTQSAGGAGGGNIPWTSQNVQGGGGGSLGIGGNGASNSAVGGAGGSGYYGGGGGAAGYTKSSGNYGAGGGGGSSYADSTLCSNITHTQGYNNGTGYIAITGINSGDVIYYTEVSTYKTYKI